MPAAARESGIAQERFICLTRRERIPLPLRSLKKLASPKHLKRLLIRLGLMSPTRLSRRRIRRLRVEAEFIDLVQNAKVIDKFGESLYTTYKATEYIVRNAIPGDFVECGVYKGRHISVMALSLLRMGESARDIYLYDTFAGMPRPGALDTRAGGRASSEQLLDKWKKEFGGAAGVRRQAPLEQVRRAIIATGYPKERFQFVVGDVHETIPNDHHDQIALLRLDTDWYESTRHELENLYDRVAPGGVVIIDDYASFDGARKAVDEFFDGRSFAPFLFRTGRSERALIKS